MTGLITIGGISTNIKMVATQTGFSSYKYIQTTDGVNDYYVGVNGVNGFSITPFQGHTNFTFNILINFPSIINSATAVKRILEIANAARTSIYGNDLGSFTSTLTDEYIGLFTNLGGITRSSGVTSATSISAGWHMVTMSVSATTVLVCIDGVARATVDGGAGRPQGASNGFTANQLSLMGTTAGSAIFGCEWREACLLTSVWSEANAKFVYDYYTRTGNVPLGNSRRSIWRHYVTPFSRAQIIALYKGNESGSDLLESNTSNSDLTKTGF